MRSTWEFTRTSIIAAPRADVWRRVVTPSGINDEMRPWMTMSVPRGAAGITIDAVVVGRPVGRAWLRLFGVLPFDYDLLTIAELEPGRRFREESTMLSMRRWVHDRTVEPEEERATRVTDRVALDPRFLLRPAGPLLALAVRAFFAHRHRRLGAHFASR
jgi:ligand-binding SRPBCC domain-containing protein